MAATASTSARPIGRSTTLTPEPPMAWNPPR